MSNPYNLKCAIVPLLVTFLVSAMAAGQTTWRVDDDAPLDPAPGDPNSSDPLEDGSIAHPFDAIQEAIYASVSGDTVLIADGTYTGLGNHDIYLGPRLITVRSENGPENCIIDCEGDPNYWVYYGTPVRGFSVGDSTPDGAVIDGLSIIRGASPGGSAIDCYRSDLTINNCIIRDNVAADEHFAWAGGGVYGYDSNMTISNCTISDNVGGYYGGGVYLDYGNSVFINCAIGAGNFAGSGGGVSCLEGEVTLINCVIADNRASPSLYGFGGGVYIEDGFGAVINTVISGNDAGSGSEMGVVSYGLPSGVTITNSISRRGSSAIAGSLFCAEDADLAVSHSDVEGGQAAVQLEGAANLTWGAGNIDVDPLLTRDGFHHLAASPCIDAGDPNGVYGGQTDIDDEAREAAGRIDMGPDEFHDVDTDGLPDWWETLYFQSPTAGVPTDDDDDDGLDNLGEYAANRDPMRPPITFYVNLAGDDGWDGLAAEWDGQHGPKATIQAGIDATDPLEGDEVVIADGVYAGEGNRDLDLYGREITVRSENGPAKCVIDCERAGRGFQFTSGETSATRVDGLTVINGSAEDGGAVLCDNGSSPHITRCVFKSNVADYAGAIYCYDSNPVFSNCTIAWNIARNNGGAVYSVESDVTFANCGIWKNEAKGSNVTGGILTSGGNLTIVSTVLWENEGRELLLSGAPSVTYCDIQGGRYGVGNIDQDPLLISTGGHLRAGSPCIDAGDPNAAYPAVEDLDGELRVANGRVDIGPDEFHDFDTDGLPDWWEALYYGSTTAADPNANEDADELINLDEYALARNPLRPPVSLHVATDGDDAWDGLASLWDGQHGPKATIQAAAAAAASYEGDEILIADGVYAGAGNRDITVGRKMVAIRSAAGPAGCIIDCESQGRGFEFRASETADLTVQGVTITNGAADLGAGVRCIAGSSPVFTQCVFQSNVATQKGGGVLCNLGAPSFLDCVFDGNVAAGSGGGAYCSVGAPSFVNCEFSDNSANAGGAAYCTGLADVSFVNCSITDNSAATTGGAVRCSGGASVPGVTCTLTDCDLSQNQAEEGGGVYALRTNLNLVRCTIVGNTATSHGGGVFCSESGEQISDCILAANSAGGRGGGMYSYEASAPTNIVDCLFVGNSASTGGGVHNYLYYYSGYEHRLYNCTVVSNVATATGGGVMAGFHCETRCTNSIIAGNTAPQGTEIAVAAQATLDLRYCDIPGGEAAAHIADPGSSSLIWGAGNIDADPFFVDPDGADNDPSSWEDNDFRLMPGSPAIDAGNSNAVSDDTLDLDGAPRFVDDPGMPDDGVLFGGLVVDMGAYEFQGETCFGSIDGDADIDLADLAGLLANYGATSGAVYTDGDLDRDEDVDLSDLATLLSVYGGVCE